jgi:hypothetical protein
MTFVPVPDHLRFYMAALDGDAAPAPLRRSRLTLRANLEGVLRRLAVAFAMTGVARTT